MSTIKINLGTSPSGYSVTLFLEDDGSIGFEDVDGEGVWMDKDQFEKAVSHSREQQG